MGLFDNFPYTNFHELNLDWILNKLKELATNWTAYSENMDKWRTDTEAAFNDLKAYVEDYFDNLDVTQEVYEKMEQFASDGTLQSILQQVVDTSQNMDLAPVACVPAYRGHTDTANEGNYSSWFQSACSDGTYLYMFFNNTTTDGPVLIKKYAIASGVLVGTNTITAYHANGADYYDGKIYLATLNADAGIVVLDPNTLTIESNIVSPGYGFRSVSVDNDGTMYAATGGTLYTVNMETGVARLKCNLQYTNEAYQSGVVRDGWLYEAGMNPSCVYKISVETGLVVHVYPIQRFIDYYCVGEVETVLADRSGHYYVGSCSRYVAASNYNFGNIFAADFNTNLQSARAYSGVNTLSIGTLHVDTTKEYMLPDGRDESEGGKPFTRLSMALMALDSPLVDTYKTIAINLHSNVTDEPFYARERFIELNGNGYSVPKIYLANCMSYIGDVTVADTITNETSLGVRPVYISGGQTRLINVTVSTARSGADYAIMLNAAGAHLFSITLNTGSADYIGTYRSTIVADAAASALAWSTSGYNMNTFSKGPSAAYSDTEIHNAANSYGALVTMERGGKRVTALLPAGASKIACGLVYVSGHIEEWDGTLTYNASTGYTFTAAAWIINSISSGTVNRTSTTAPNVENVVWLGH